MVEKRREGGQPKDKVIVDGFNTKKRNNLSQALLRKAKLEKARQDNEKRKAERDLQALEEQVKLARQAMGKKPKEKVVEDDSEPDSNPANPEDDVKSAYQMLQDMRWVYKNVKGRQRLKELCADDKQFLFMVKELMKIEAGLMNAKIKRNEDGEGGGQTTVFVVMKGLMDEVKVPDKKVGKVIDVGNKDDGDSDQEVDFKQIEHILNPEAAPYEEPREIEPVVEGPKLDW